MDRCALDEFCTLTKERNTSDSCQAIVYRLRPSQMLSQSKLVCPRKLSDMYYHAPELQALHNNPPRVAVQRLGLVVWCGKNATEGRYMSEELV